MSKRKIAWNMFTNKRKDKKGGLGKMGTTDSTNYENMAKLLGITQDKLEGYMQATATTTTATSTAAGLQQQLNQLSSQQANQLQNAYGSNAIQYPVTTTTGGLGTTWVQTPTPYVSPMYTTTTETSDELHQIMVLQVINLIANFGPTVAKKIVSRFKINVKREEIDQIHKDLTKSIADDDDPDLDKAINEAVKEVKV